MARRWKEGGQGAILQNLKCGLVRKDLESEYHGVFMPCATDRKWRNAPEELLGHSDVRTTRIYSHTVQSRTIKEVGRPLDCEAGE